MRFKKSLMATSAIVGVTALIAAAPAFAQDKMEKKGPGPVMPQGPLTVTLGGDGHITLGWTDEDLNTRLRNTAMQTDSEIFIDVDGVADNGLRYGARIQLESDENSGDGGLNQNADEYYFYLANDRMGRLQLGDKEGAARAMVYGAPAGGYGGGGAYFSDWQDYEQGAIAGFQLSGGGGASSQQVTSTDDTTKITYYTPRWSGFQFGASWTPNNGNTGQLNSRVKQFTPAGVTTRQIGGGPARFDAFHQDVVDLGVNFVQSFNGVGVAVSAVYQTGDAKASAGSPGVQYEDISDYALGASVSYAGFTIGGQYANRGDSGYLKTGTFKDDAEGWGAGIGYRAGPFAIAVHYLEAETESDSAISGDDTMEAWGIAAGYSAAPGLRFTADLVMVEKEDEASASGPAPTGSLGKNDSTIFILGTYLSF